MCNMFSLKTINITERNQSKTVIPINSHWSEDSTLLNYQFPLNWWESSQSYQKSQKIFAEIWYAGFKLFIVYAMYLK